MKKFISFFLIFLLLAPTAASADFPHSDLDPSTIPTYTAGSDYYVEINDGVPSFEIWQHTAFSFVLFSELDSLGRPGPAYACLGPETLPTDVRGPIGDFYPSGWQNTRYGDLVDGGSLYSRSHLIGYLLCADNGSPENLFTGTRHLNGHTMVLVETAIEKYILETGHHVLYRVTPFYYGEDLVPFGVQMEALSMETDEDGICCNLFLYNVQPGVKIDYSTGASSRKEKPVPSDGPKGTEEEIMRTVPAVTPEPVLEKPQVDVTYVLNKSAMKFHKPDCKSVAEMRVKNREDVDWTREEVVAAGYRPCGSCNP